MKTYSAIGLVAAIAILLVFLLDGCKTSFEKKVEESINYETEPPTLTDYDGIVELYVQEKGDTIGLYKAIYEIFISNELNPAGIPTAKGALPKKIRVYLDNSASMMGYMVPASKDVMTNEFTKIFSSGIGEYYKGEDIVAFYVNKPQQSAGAELVEVPFEDMTSKLTHKSVPKGDAYTMDGLLEQIVETALADTVHAPLSFIITDGILSGTDKEIAADRKFNIQNKDELRRRINVAMSKASGKGYGVAIYPFQANFDGTYYTYSNGQVNLSNSKRPFYLIVFGDKNLVRDFSVNGIKNLEPLDGNSVLMIDSVGSLVPNIGNAIVEEEVKEGDVTRLIIVPSQLQGNYAALKLNFPLERFPDYMRNLVSLQEGLKITLGERELDPSTYQILDSSILSVPCRIEMGDHHVKVELESELPDWIETVSTDDDSNIKSALASTFLFEEFVEGLQRGIYNLKNNDLGSAEFILDWTSGKTE